MTAKKLYLIGIAYLIILVTLGFYLGVPVLIGMATFFIGVSIWQIKDYEKIPLTKLTFFWLPPFLFLGLFGMFGLNSFVDYADNKNQLQTVSGIIPEKATYVRKSRYISSYYLAVANKAFHCLDNYSDACQQAYNYKGEKAIIWYQPHTANGNLVYEIQVGDKLIYEFDKQKSAILADKVKAEKEWGWTFGLIVLPSIWFGWQHYKLRKALPKLSNEEIQVYVQQQQTLLQQQNNPLSGCFGMVVLLLLLVGFGGFSILTLYGFNMGDIGVTILSGVCLLMVSIALFFVIKKSPLIG